MGFASSENYTSLALTAESTNDSDWGSRSASSPGSVSSSPGSAEVISDFPPSDNLSSVPVDSLPHLTFNPDVSASLVPSTDSSASGPSANDSLFASHTSLASGSNLSELCWSHLASVSALNSLFVSFLPLSAHFVTFKDVPVDFGTSPGSDPFTCGVDLSALFVSCASSTIFNLSFDDLTRVSNKLGYSRGIDF